MILNSGIFVGPIRTRHGILGYQMKVPVEAAKVLYGQNFRIIKHA